MDDPALRAIDEFVVEFVNARKFLQFYPSNNSRLRESLGQLYRSFRRLVDGSNGERPVAPDGIVLSVGRKHLYYGPHELGKGFNPVRRLSTDLYRLGVKTFHILPEATRVDLQQFLDASCMKPETVREEGGIEKVLDNSSVRGVRVSFPGQIALTADEEPEATANGYSGGVDMLGYLRSAQALRQPGDFDEPGYSAEAEDTADITEITDFFADIMSGSEEKMSYFMQTLSDPVRLREALEHIHELDASRNRPVGSTRPLEVLKKSFSQMLANIRGFSADVREEYIRTIGMAILGAAPEVQETLVSEGLASEIGKSEIADAVLAVLPDADVARALLDAVRFHQGTSNTISNFMQEFATDPRRRAAIARLMTRLSADDDSAAVSEAIDLLRTGGAEHEDAPLPGHYMQSGLDVDQNDRLQLSRLMDLSEPELDRIEESVESDFHLHTSQHAARTLLELYVQPTIEGVTKRTSERLTQQLLEILEDGGYEYLAETIRTVETELPRSAQARARPELENVLTECAYPTHINRILSKMRKVGRLSYEFAQLRFLLDALGERVLDHLFLRLEMEHSRSMRMFFLDLFRQFGDKAQPLLNRKMRHRDWFVVRNVVYILGSLGTEIAVHSLINLLDHQDMRVRREAVRALARTGGAVAEDALLNLLDDDEPSMRRIAAEWLGYMGCERALPELRERLARASQSPNNDDLLIGLVRGIGRLGGRAEAALIRQYVPRSGAFRGEKKRELSKAGKEALARLEKPALPAEPQRV